MDKSVEFALTLAVDSMNSRKRQEERNLELEKLMSEKEEIISKLQQELQHLKDETAALRNCNKSPGNLLETNKKRGYHEAIERCTSEFEPLTLYPLKKICGNSSLVQRQNNEHGEDNASVDRQTQPDNSHDEHQKSHSPSMHLPEKALDDDAPVQEPKSSRSDSESSERSENDSDSDDESWIVKEAFSAGPFEPDVIPSFLGHVASRIWRDEMRGQLCCANKISIRHELKEWYTRISEQFPKAKEMIDRTGLSELPLATFDHLDIPLISAFIERWQPDTNSFHMPFGEITIMLHDVWHILHIPVEGQMVTANPDPNVLESLCMQMLDVSKEELMSKHWVKDGVLTHSIFRLCGGDRDEETQATAWLWTLLDSILFVDCSGNRARPSCLNELVGKLDGVGSYSWGSATLAYLYRQLGVASRGDAKFVGGCMTLLQAWIYEYFPRFWPHQKKRVTGVNWPRARQWIALPEEISDDRLASLRSRLDDLKLSDVEFMPFGKDVISSVPRTTFTGWVQFRDIIEPYMPGRSMRQLGCFQTIPDPITAPTKVVRSSDPKRYMVNHDPNRAREAWELFPGSFSLKLTEPIDFSKRSATCDVEYIEWYYSYSHPKLLQETIRREVEEDLDGELFSDDDSFSDDDDNDDEDGDDDDESGSDQDP